jgi:DNA repair protein RadD
MSFNLRDYQEIGKKDIQEFIHESSHIKGVLVSPVATGKSLYPSIIAENTKGNCLIVQPNKELLEQNVEKARNFGLDPSIYSASAGSKDISKLTYATPMSIAKKPEDFKHFNIVGIDECHLSMTNTYSNGKISSKGTFNKFLDQIKPEKIIGLTATPIQLVSQGFGGSELKMVNRSMRSFWYKSDIFHVTQIPDIAQDYWAELDIRTYDIDQSALELNSNGSEFKEASVIKQYEDNGIEFRILEKYYDLHSKGFDNILTFVPSVEQAIRLAKKNKDFEVVYDKTPAKEREAIVKAFKRGDIPHLLNVNIFTTGFDHPALKGIILGRETNSFSLFYQMCGRVCRPLIIDGNVIGKKGIIEDLTGNTKRFGSIENITFEKNDYTNGWGMWNNDRLLTGYPFGNWDMPLREDLILKFEKKGIVNIDVQIKDIKLTFGKYKGKKLKESFEKDPRYFIWVRENFDWTKRHTRDLFQPLNSLIEKHIAHGK